MHLIFVRTKICKIPLNFGFLPSSASVERTFSYYNKLLREERECMEEKTIEQVLYLYVNSKNKKLFNLYYVIFS